MKLLTLPRAALATSLGVATAARGARVFHPRGSSSEAVLTVEGGNGWGSAVLDEPGVHGGLVRVSRGIGLPTPLPDIEGLAVRLPGLGIDGAPLDLSINSAWRYVFAPSVLTRTWSAVLPYRTGSGRLIMLGARPLPEGFRLLAATPLGTWRSWGVLTLGSPVDGEGLCFAPTVGADDLVPVELFRTVRGWSYVASQAARGDAAHRTRGRKNKHRCERPVGEVDRAG